MAMKKITLGKSYLKKIWSVKGDKYTAYLFISADFLYLFCSINKGAKLGLSNHFNKIRQYFYKI